MNESTLFYTSLNIHCKIIEFMTKSKQAGGDQVTYTFVLHYYALLYIWLTSKKQVSSFGSSSRESKCSSLSSRSISSLLSVLNAVPSGVSPYNVLKVWNKHWQKTDLDFVLIQHEPMRSLLQQNLLVWYFSDAFKQSYRSCHAWKHMIIPDMAHGGCWLI